MLVNCTTCGRLFPGNGQFGLCTDCSIKNQSEVQRVNEFLLIRPDASLEDMTERTGVPRANIIRMMRDGKLTIQHSLTRCSRCHKTFENSKKDLCEECMAQLTINIRSELLGKNIRQKAGGRSSRGF